MSVIAVSGLGKRYAVERGEQPLEVLRDVSFTAGDGDFLGIIGPSGCGKTTLLKIIGGLIPYERGEIRNDGALLAGPGPDRRMVFQDFALLPWRTVLGNVEFGLEVKGLARAERRERSMQAIARIGLSGFEEYYPYQLSGGMQQRTGLARALVMNPKVLLMDEPFGALDAQTRRALQEDLLGLVEGGGLTVLLATHDMEEAVLLADRILVLDAHPGRVKDLVEVVPHLPRPRGGRIDEVRSSPRYAELVEHVWRQLRSPASVPA